MLRPILPLLALIFTLPLFAQNLVPNPSFEEYENGCPENYNEMPVGWRAWRWSPNSFSTCVEPIDFGDSLGWAPLNAFGIQAPYDGNSYLGVCPFGGIDFTEIIGVQLVSPLIVGEPYYVSFKVSRAEGGFYFGDDYFSYASSHLGALFTMQGYDYYTDDTLTIPGFAHVYTEDIITETEDWVAISGWYTADEPYTHLGLGNFFFFSEIDVIQVTPGNDASYYYIDDVCVSPTGDCDDVVTIAEESSSDLLIYPNPSSGAFTVKTKEAISGYIIRDATGAIIVASAARHFENIELQMDSQPCGLYFIEVWGESGKLLQQKIQIIR